MAHSLGPCKQLSRCSGPHHRAFSRSGACLLVPAAYKRNNQRAPGFVDLPPVQLPPLDPNEVPPQRAAPTANPGQQQPQQQPQQLPQQLPNQQQPNQQQAWQQQSGQAPLGPEFTTPAFAPNPYIQNPNANPNYPPYNPNANPGYRGPGYNNNNNNGGGGGGYRNNNNRQGGYTQAPGAFTTDPAFWSSPPSQAGNWGHNPNRQAGGFNSRGNFNNRGFTGFVDDPTADLLLADLDMQGYSVYDRWEPEEEVPVEEDTSPKYVNGKRVLVNKEITAASVRVQDAQKQEVGVMSFDEARQAALETGADVVLINDSAQPPVVRLIEFGKYKFELERAAKQKQKSSKGTETKEVRLRPVTEAHDYEVKVKAARGFLSKGSKVKLTMQFSGREMRFKDQGKEMMLKLIEELSEVAKMDAPLSLRSSTFSAILSPLK